MGETNDIDLELPEGGFDRPAAVRLVEQTGIADYFEDVVPGPFGQTSLSLGALERLVHAVDIGMCAAECLRGAIMEDHRSVESFTLPDLKPEHRRLIASFQAVVTADAFNRRVRELCELPDVDGSLELDGLFELLEAHSTHAERIRHILDLARAYIEMRHAPSSKNATEADEGAVQALSAFLTLLRNTLIRLAKTSSMRPLLHTLQARRVRVAGYPYDGLEVRELTRDRGGLLPFTPDDIVGNEEFLQAGLRLARDVAGFDFQTHENPKKVNPVLFGLGRPGSGKTVTAHAIGNYFLDFCSARDVPARFLVVRRTDWASSYQNASAVNLVRLFREEVYGFDGVCGVYWPDIDTAFASRASNSLRQEEKQNLGAVFGVFDGTLLPRDGKWFLICDANTLHMDDATVSRIAQNPYNVDGPKTPAHFVELMREILLGDVAEFLPDDDETWEQIGSKCVDYDLSGRNVDSICGNIRAHIQDFDYPDEYFQADSERRREIVSSLGRPVDEQQILTFLADFVSFKREAEERAEEERFEDEVEEIIRRLNARSAAARIAGEKLDLQS